MKRSLRRAPWLFWHRLPYIAVYALAFYIIFFIGQRVFYQIAPPTYFLDYYSVNVPSSIKKYENEPVPFTVCRHKRGNYPVQGYRIIYKMKNETTRNGAKQVANYPIEGQITQNTCSDASISPSRYSHPAGVYYFKTVLNFRVNGQDKQVTFVSNTYTIEKKVLTPDELRERIEQLEREIEILKLQLAVALANSGTTSASQGGGASTTMAPRQAANNNQNSNTQTPTTNNENNTDSTPQPPPSEQPEPVRVFGVPLCVPIINVCANQ